MLLIPGSNSGTGMLQLLMDSGGVGIIFEAEADTDTFVTAIQSEYGTWGDLLRNAFDHQPLPFTPEDVRRRGCGAEHQSEYSRILVETAVEERTSN